MNGRAETALVAAGAAWGFAAGIAIATLWFLPAHPGQLPGTMLVYGVDARAPMRMMWSVMLAPFAGALLLKPVALYLSRDARTQRWSIAAMIVALLAGLSLAVVDPFNVVAVIFGPIVLASAFLLLRHVPLTRIRIRRRALITFVIYPAIALAIGAASTDWHPRLNFFEDGHSLTPANEMRHGARPYRDIVPVHGLISDGLFDDLTMTLGAKNAGEVLRARDALTIAIPLALYAIALATTGSPTAALITVLVAASVTITGTPWVLPLSALASVPPVRALPSLFALALCASALRRPRPHLLAWAGALTVLACFASLDFGFFALVALFMAVIRSGRGWIFAAAGLAIAGGVAMLALAMAGAIGAFFHVMLFEIPPIFEAYSVAIFRWPPGYEHLQAFPEALAGLFLPRTIWIVAWGLIAIGTAAALALWRRSRIIDPLLPLGGWVIAAAVSFGERTNVYFMPVVVVIAVSLVYALRRRPVAFGAGVLILLVIAAPSRRIAGLLRPAPQPPAVRYNALPRARGVWIEPDNAQKLAAAQTFIDRALRPGQTFFDFANMPILYYLFDRRCPVRQYETPLYETEALQREVISRLEHDRSVRAALMQFPNQGAVAIDGVPNAVRAPLVFAWLRTHFVPAYAKDGVVFWMRADQPTNL